MQPADCPRITFLVRDGMLETSAEWPEGTDLTMFAHMLKLLHRGRYMAAANRAVRDAGKKMGGREEHKAVSVCDYATGDLPAVSPAETFKHLARMGLD